MTDRYIPAPPKIDSPTGDDWYSSDETSARAPQLYRRRDFIKGLFKIEDSFTSQSAANLEKIFGIKQEYLDETTGIGINKIGFATSESASVSSWSSKAKINLRFDGSNGLKSGPHMDFSFGGNSHSVGMIWADSDSFGSNSPTTTSLSGFAKKAKVVSQEFLDRGDLANYNTGTDDQFDTNTTTNALYMAKFSDLEMYSCNIYKATDSGFHDITFKQKTAVSSLDLDDADYMSIFAAANSSVAKETSLKPSGNVSANSVTDEFSAGYFRDKFAGELEKSAIDGIIGRDKYYGQMNIIDAQKGTGTIGLHVHEIRTFWANVDSDYSFTNYATYFSVFNPTAPYLNLSLVSATNFSIILGLAVNLRSNWGLGRVELLVAILYLEYAVGGLQSQWLTGTFAATKAAPRMANEVLTIGQTLSAGDAIFADTEAAMTELRNTMAGFELTVTSMEQRTNQVRAEQAEVSVSVSEASVLLRADA